ncbi:unnamed protein product [Tuber melanosporum]|jgi:bud site selection protein 20|uniref:(Perigord truffle) hypothetical protein n=1 Tax=Tuber melanosporum (strain Mel28) TaxID=656061 RepID=D5GDU6_TUBMM|nr:uncharacterized protein GSTUM_00006279001 [Tuber melanosporum]CAZ82689.1 unnamed protein product [Tuber melanosporum]
MGAIRRSKTKRRTRDMDQVHSDLRDPKQLAQLKALVPDEDKPGLGQFHCVECAKYFESEWNMVQHRRGKNHKRRVRLLKEEPYSQKEADAAAGIGTAAFYQASEDRREQEKMDQQFGSMEPE